MTNQEHKYTPGPWEQFAKLTASENHKGFDVQDVASQHWIATVGPRDMDGIEGEANAHLIAAAPDLLEALMAVDEWLDDQSLAQPAVSRQGIRDAIAKALGREVAA